MDTLIEVKGLTTNFYTESGVIPAVNKIDFAIEREKTLGIVGEKRMWKVSHRLVRHGPDPGTRQDRIRRNSL